MGATVASLPKRTRERWLGGPDGGLMLGARDGNNDSFAELVQRYGRRVLGFFRRELANRPEAEDLTQEVFLRLYRYRNRYKPRARFSTWIFFIARNVARNARRSQRRHPSVQINPTAEKQQTV